MAQTYKYTIVGDTKPAVAGNEALDASINKVDISTKQLNTDLNKTSIEANKAFSQELETKIKATDAKIKTISGTVGLFTGTLSTAIGALGLFGIEDEQIAGFQKATLSVLALGSGAAQAITGFKDLTEARKLQNEVAIASTSVENANTAALTAQAAAAGGVTIALGNAATSITSETVATEANTIAKVANIASDEALFAERNRLAAQGIIRTEAEIAQTLATEANTAATAASATATAGLTVATAELTLAQRALNLVAKANPYIAIASILFAVGSAIFALTRDTKNNTDAEKANAEARKENEAAMRSEEDASLKLLRARRASNVEIAEETLRLAKNRKERAENEFAAAQQENKFSERTKNARASLEEVTLDLQIAELDLEAARKEARVKAKEDAKTAADKAKELRNQKLEAEGLIQVIKNLNDELANDILGIKVKPDTFFDPNNLKSVDDTLKSIVISLEALDLEELNEPVKFLSQEQLDILKRLRGELGTELQQQLFDREKQYRDELRLFADNENAKTQLTEEYERDRAKIRRQYAIQTATEIIGVTSNFLSVIAEINQQSLELQLAQAAGNQAAIDKINADALEKQKKLRIAQTVITTAESILNGFNATSTLPPPFNFIAGGILAAAYAALGAKTIQAISATSLEGGGSISGVNNAPSVGGFSLPGGTGVPVGGPLPGLGGGRTTTPTIGTVAEGPIRAYVLAGDVENGVQANIALNNRRRLAG